MKDFSFDISRSRPPHVLSAVLGADSFFYGLFDSEHQLYSCTYHEDFDYSDASIEALAAELNRYKGVPQKLAISTKPFLHVPAGQASITDYYPAYDDKLVQSEPLSGSDTLVLYGLNARQQKVVDDSMDSPEMHHISKVLHAGLVSPSNSDTVNLSLYIDADVAHYTATGPQGLLLYNQFYCANKTDYLYHTILVYKALGLSTSEHALQLLGRVEQESDIYELLHDYIQDIDFVADDQLSISDMQHKGSKHVYQDLYSTMLCE